MGNKGSSKMKFLTLCFFLTSCGYHLGYNFAGDLKRLKVPIFANRTYWRGLEYTLTRRVIERLRQSGQVILTNKGADFLLLGTIFSYQRGVLTESRENVPLEMGVTIGVSVEFRSAQGKFLWKKNFYEGHSFYVGVPSQAHPSSLVVGEEEVQKLVLDRLAEKIVNFLEEKQRSPL